jgi:threonine aldolase
VPEWSELEAIRAWCTENSVLLHMDGARLWDAAPYYAAGGGAGVDKTIRDVCGLFDSVYVSWYKGMGALCGATLLAPQHILDRCWVWLRRMGGNLFTVMPFEGTSGG